MTDRELLELAAKAAGHTLGYNTKTQRFYHNDAEHNSCGEPWDPLADDGDALRLAVKLGMVVRQPCKGVVTAYSDTPKFMATPPTEYIEPDLYAATRRAIVRAAAEIGRAM